MIEVTIGTNTNRSKIVVDPNTTIRRVLEDEHIDYSVGAIHLDGVSLTGGDFDKTFKDFNISEKCYLIAVVKADGGVY